METLSKPWWWSEDVEFDVTGETQRGWARDGAAAYRAAHPERYGVSLGVTDSVTPLKSVTVSKGALRARRWRKKQRRASDELP